MNTNNVNSPLGAGGMDERLWNFIDGRISTDERSVIERLLKTDTAWNTKYQELLQVNEILRTSELDAPSLRFTKNVMEEISKLHIAPAAKTYINKKIIWGIACFFIVIMIGFLAFGFGQMDWNSGGDSSISKNLNKINLSKFFSNTWVNVFMMINVVLGLFLLDNYLSDKRKEFRKA